MTSPRTLQSVVDSLGEHAEKTALVVFGRKDRQQWCFKKLAACVRSFANGLIRHDFESGDTFAIFAENSAQWIAAALGIIRAGMIIVPLDVQLLDNRLLEHRNARLLRRHVDQNLVRDTGQFRPVAGSQRSCTARLRSLFYGRASRCSSRNRWLDRLLKPTR